MPYLSRKVLLPSTNRKGIRTYYHRRGYRENPLLQSRKGAKMTFVKPLPDGRRIHDRVYEFKNHYAIKRHIDSFDPGRSPGRHVLVDLRTARATRTFKIPKVRTSESILRRIRRTLGTLM
jgi:hypothetical protein